MVGGSGVVAGKALLIACIRDQHQNNHFLVFGFGFGGGFGGEEAA